MTQNDVLLFCAAGLILALAAVIVDRLNFPQRRFRPKAIEVDPRYSNRDRTGAHVNTLETKPAQDRTVGQVTPSAHNPQPDTPNE